MLRDVGFEFVVNTMVNKKREPLNDTFMALANRTRRAILLRLADSPCVVAELGQPFAMTAPAISRHLRVLERAGLIVRTRDGQRQLIRLKRQSLHLLRGFLTELEVQKAPERAAADSSKGSLADRDWDTDDEEWTKLL